MINDLLSHVNSVVFTAQETQEWAIDLQYLEQKGQMFKIHFSSIETNSCFGFIYDT